MKRVVVTGIGLVTPLGCGINTNWKRLISGKSGASRINGFDAENFKCQVACEVPQDISIEGSFIEEQWIEKKEIKKIDKFIKFSLAACEEAFQISNINKINDPASYRAGCIVGSGMGGLPGNEAGFSVLCLPALLDKISYDVTSSCRFSQYPNSIRAPDGKCQVFS